MNENRIVKYTSNGKVILLNKENMHWVRMSSTLYQSKIEDKRAFQEELINKFDFNAECESCSCAESLHIITTRKCNMSCDFCSVNCAPDVSVDDELTVAGLKERVIPIIQELKPSLQKVIISGGEPFVKVEIEKLVEGIVNFIRKDNIVFQTNGLLLNEERINFLLNNVGVIEISIENLFYNTNQYEKMCSILDVLYNRQARLSFSYVVTPYNKEYIERGLALAARYNAYFQFRMVAPIGRGKAFSIDLYEQINLYQRAVQFILSNEYMEKNLSYAFAYSLAPKKHCGAVNNILTIAPDGNVYMCPNMLFEMFKIGDMSEDAKRIIEKHRKKASTCQIDNLFNVEKIQKCSRCVYEFFCGGDCAANCTNELGNRIEERDCSLQKILTYYTMFVKKDNYKNDFEQLDKYLKYILENFEQVQCEGFFAKEIEIDYEL